MGQFCVKPTSHCVPGFLCQEETSATQSLALDRFELFRVIGCGSYSQVRLAKMLDTGIPVAIKMMDKSHIVRNRQVAHIFQEKQLLRLITSPFVVRLIGTFQDQRNLYCVMEYVSGGELFKRMCDQDRLTKEEAQFYIAEIVFVLCHLHSISCIYRDLKPENVLLSTTGHIKLADFGFAKVMDNCEKTYTTCGTPEYLSPEIVSQNGHNLATDWWQVGILLYEMLEARTPFADSSPYRLYENVLTKPVDFPPKRFDDPTQSLLSGLLEKDPERRLVEAQVKSHPFFKTVDWGLVERQGLTPPFQPSLADPFDTKYFDQFDEEGISNVPEPQECRALDEY